MHALILSCRSNDWVERYFLDYSELSLPLAGKPIVEHQLDWCARLGATKVRVYDAAFDRRLLEALGDGSRWGLDLAYEQAPLGLIDDDVLAREKSFLADGGGEPLVILGPEILYRGERLRIRSLREYFELNFKLIGDPAECVLPGYASDHGVILGMNVQIRMGCVVKPPVLLDDNVLIDYECQLNGSVVVCEGCILDRRSHLHRAIVFPRTYVARGVELENKIVVGARIIDPMTGACVNLADDVLSANLNGRRRWLPLWASRLFRKLRRMFGRHA